MNVIVSFQVCHPFANLSQNKVCIILKHSKFRIRVIFGYFFHLSAHIQEGVKIDLKICFISAQVVEKSTMFHVFSDNVDRSMLAAHTVQLNEIRVLEFTTQVFKIS